MKKILIDTNVWLRYFLEDSPAQALICQKLFEIVENGKLQPYISNITLFEIAYTLKTYYRLPISKITRILNDSLKTRNLTIIEKTDSKKALALFSKTKIKYADCLIATQIKPGMKLVTYDRDFEKLIPQQSITPSEAVN